MLLKVVSLLAFVLCVFAQQSVVAEDFQWASPFGDSMILQRDMPPIVWGWGTPGETVTVEIDDQKATTKVEADGRWKVSLEPISSGGPYELHAASGQKRLIARDVLIGEVWICSGQSNMQMGYNGIPEIRALAQQAKSLPIRCLKITQDVAFAEQDQCQATWINGPGSSAVATAFAYDLQQALDVPVAVIETSWGSSSIEGWMPRALAGQLPHFQEQLNQLDTEDHDRVASLIAKQADGRRWTRDENIFLRKRPNLLYNAMLHPLEPLRVRGMVWYQGEANSHSIESMRQYGETLTLWTKLLRDRFENEDFQMLAVMLPRYGRMAATTPTQDVESPIAHGWAWIREAQAKLLELPNTGLANTIDLGHLTNIHPSDKRPIGKRLALIAEDLLQPGRVEASGPQLDQFQIDGATAIVSFSHAQGLKTTDGNDPTGFWIAGKDGKWMPAEATIDGQSVRLNHQSVPSPVAVRYAFASFPQVNLVNEQDLPAVPFRTDRDAP
ncbi:sialate O-acetylesterase [Bremerella sp. JC770]|uniref:sialate O-acetylesterase n=1 Tax=Bremerella sp. JC770 TaxID=3232137 RepID=UPI00345B42E7